MSQFNIDEIEKHTLSGLKDFQRATVERVDYLFRHNQNRVLVADEVGMGKTLIARGAIVKTARLKIEEKDDLFKIIYICSNQNIANQNIRYQTVYAAFKDYRAGERSADKGRLYTAYPAYAGNIFPYDFRRRKCAGKSTDVCHFKENAGL